MCVDVTEIVSDRTRDGSTSPHPPAVCQTAQLLHVRLMGAKDIHALDNLRNLCHAQQWQWEADLVNHVID